MGFFPSQGANVATIITVAVLSAAGLFSGVNYWTGAQHFSVNPAIDTGIFNYSGHLIPLPAHSGALNTITLLLGNGTFNGTVSSSATISGSTLSGTLPGNPTFSGNLIMNGNEDFGNINTDKFPNAGIIVRNPANTFATTYSGPAVLSNQTYGLYGLPLINATTGHLAGNATGTTSTSIVMSGNYATFTPQQDTRAEVSVMGVMKNSISGDGCRVDVRFGTSNLGANGAALTGTLLGNWLKTNSTGTGQEIPFNINVFHTGMTIGTKYYYDITQAAITGGTCTLLNVNWTIKEI